MQPWARLVDAIPLIQEQLVEDRLCADEASPALKLGAAVRTAYAEVYAGLTRH